MKTRNGFVSNSSTSSFVVDKNGLDDAQIKTVVDWLRDEEDNNPEVNFNETPRHIFGQISYHVKRSIWDLGIPETNIDSER